MPFAFPSETQAEVICVTACRSLWEPVRNSPAYLLCCSKHGSMLIWRGCETEAAWNMLSQHTVGNCTGNHADLWGTLHEWEIHFGLLNYWSLRSVSSKHGGLSPSITSAVAGLDLIVVTIAWHPFMIIIRNPWIKVYYLHDLEVTQCSWSPTARSSVERAWDLGSGVLLLFGLRVGA